jgi:NitT/TauT family transport system substrate-binding protein
MIEAWYDAEKFIREHPDQAVKIMSKVVGLKTDEYKIFLPGTKFFAEADNLEAFGPPDQSRSLLNVAPAISDFLLDNRLMEGTVDFAQGVDGSLIKEIADRK